jgi:glycosyltransferase involved in cell wall biosynthesis
MKIGFVSIINESWGGSEELWAAAAVDLVKQGHTVFASGVDTGSVSTKWQHLIDTGVHVTFRRGYIKPGIPVKERVAKKIQLFIANKLDNPYKKFFDSNPDITVYTGACDSLKYDPFFLQILYARKTPLILLNQVHYEYQKTFDEQEGNTILEAYRYAKKNLFVSERNKLVMERFLASTIPNALVVRNPVNLPSIQVLDYPTTETIQFAIVANLLINHKGHDILFEVLSQEKWRQRAWHLNIYGSGVDESYLKRLSTFYKLQNYISFHGKVSDIKAVWKKNHMLVMPSRLEGIPLALVEAMLCGRPSVVTDVAGHTEWVRDGIDGFIAEGANILSFDRAMERAWKVQSQWPSIGQQAFERAMKLYDPTPEKTLAEIILSSATRS